MEWSESVRQNLEDAGCDEDLMRQYVRMEEQIISQQAICRQQTQLLRGYRRELLDHLHEDQRRIDCLDHLLYQLKEQART